MIISHELKFVFLGIPRTANRAMHAALLALPGTQRVGLLHNMVIPEECASYFKFCCIRNPYRRHLAYYLWRKQPHPWGSEAAEMTYGEYIEACAQGRMGPNTLKEFSNGHHLDHVVRYEELPASFHAIPIPGMTQLEIPIRGARLSRHWRSYYDEGIADRVYQLASSDFEEFGYTRDSWQEP